ncbi:MAG TPA: hypothetical protein VLC71_00850 [Thermomonas sp.]|nr:hypothetical protein [Thermomonas sp.]
MNGLASRYWQSLSPALRRYYRASVWPSVAFVAFVVLHECVSRQAGPPASLRTAFALAPVLAMAWMFAVYLRFLRDCDELERRIELDALAWAAGIGLLAVLTAMLLLDAGVVAWPARHVASGIGLLLVGGYGLVRGLLHRRYP